MYVAMDIEKIMEALGLDSSRWKWRLYRWRQRRAARTAPAASVRPSASPTFCPRCQALLAGERACPYCGARVGSARVRVVKRSLGLALPAWLPVSSLLVLANLTVLVVTMILFGPRQLFDPSGEALVAMGALVPPLVGQGEAWRLITYGYLHIGLLHIVFNLFALTQVGPMLEEQIGSARFFVVYTLALVGGAAADLLLRGDELMTIAGASGALFGLIGFGVSYGHFYGGAAGHAQRDFFLRWALYGFIFGLVAQADNIAHGGGFAVGALMGWLVERERHQAARFTPWYRAAAALCAVLTLGAYAWMIAAR